MNERLTLQDLVDILAEKQNISKKNSESFLRELFSLITETISSKDYVRIKDFGTFKLVAVSSRKSVDVNTGEPIEIPPHYKLSFSPEKSFREQINSPFAHIQSVLLDDNEEEQGDLKVTPLSSTINVAEVAEIEEDEEDPIVIEEIDTIEPTEEEFTAEVVPIQEETLILEEDLDSDLEGIDFGDNAEDNDIVVNDIVSSEIKETDIINNISEDEDIVEDTEVEQNHKDTDTSFEEDEDIAEFLKDYKTNRTRNIIIGICVALVVIIAIVFIRKKNNDVPEAIVAQVETQNTESSDDTDNVVLQDDSIDQAPLVDNPDKETQAQAEKTEEQAKQTTNATESKIIKLKKGESLQVLAKRYFGDNIFWIYIYKENSDVIKKPDAIFAGMDLKIPSAAKYNINASDPKSIEKAKQEVANMENGAKVVEPKKQTEQPRKQAEQPKTTSKSTTVKLQKGETLQTLAKKHFGDKIFWVYIFEENSNVIKNPDAIFADMELKIPPASKYKVDPKDPKSIEKATLLQRQIFKKYAK